MAAGNGTVPAQAESKTRTIAEASQQVFISFSFDSPLLLNFITWAVFMVMVDWTMDVGVQRYSLLFRSGLGVS
jgi:hypothetical protein